MQQTPPGDAKPWDLYPARQRGVFLLILFLVSTSNYVDRNIIGVLLEPIKAEFHVSDTMLGLLSGFSFAVFYALLGIPVARWADRGDRKKIITGALAVWSVMTVLCGMATNFWQLALARVGVGAGEAGAIPPAQSLLADYYAPERRGKAMGVFMMSSMAGYVLGLVVGGWVAQYYGWRLAFIIAGAPGLLLAVVVHFVLREPRHVPQFAVKREDHETVRAAFTALLRKPAYVNILLAMILYFIMAYGALVFVVPFMIRVHGMTVAEAGGIFGGIAAVGAVIGNLLGGVVADRLASKDVRWFALLPGYGLIVALPLYEFAFMAPTATIMTAILFVSGILLTGSIPGMFSALHVVCGSKRRAMSVAIVFFFANLIGLGLGPILTGALSDYFTAQYGAAQGLRYAMMIVVVSFVPSGLFLLRAARTLKQDAEA
jgi:predicted MFS family arabinose efflux permease